MERQQLRGAEGGGLSVEGVEGETISLEEIGKITRMLKGKGLFKVYKKRQ